MQAGTWLQVVKTAGEATDQGQVVAVDFPDQTGLFAVPLLYLHQLPIYDGNNGLQEANEHEEDASERWNPAFSSPTSPKWLKPPADLDV